MSKLIPKPSPPSIIPIRRKTNNTGTPNLYPVLLNKILANHITAPINSIFSGVKNIIAGVLG